MRILGTLIFQKRLSLFDAACTLRLRKQANGKGTYYVPEFTDVRPVDPPGRYRERYEQFAGYDSEATFEAERGASGPGVPDHGVAGIGAATT